ncbi:MAG: xanthine dehydrogenase family protein molybdopterin-binding subunit [Acidimicrobiales bacterium]|nr:xanthine dehydrogenase family protein molybdopterin-binding subunit [Acidimicrobiales bacterium]
MIGTRVVRKEDPELLTVGGRYVDDLAPSDSLFVTFVRSLMAHAELADVDVSEARDMPGVVAVYTVDDLGLNDMAPGNPMINASMGRPVMARGRVRFVGEPIVAIVSQTRAQGVDAAEMVFVDYEPLEALVDVSRSATDELLLFADAGTNTSLAMPSANQDDIFADCEVTVGLHYKNHRQAPCPIEPRSTVSSWSAGEDGRPRLTQWSCTQFPHGARDALAAGLGVDKDQVHVITPDVGGGFGAKSGAYPEDLVVAAIARDLDRPIRWTETRSESMTGLVHGRGWTVDARIGGSRDGNVTSLEVRILADAGAYPAIGSVLPFFGSVMATGVYDIPKVDVASRSVVTNTVPMGAYRGAGRPEAALTIERMMDMYAAEIGMDPAELRRRNFVAPEAFPFTSPTGAAMDSGQYEKALDAVMSAAGYEQLRAEQARRRSDPAAKQLGLGWSAYVEIANPMGSGEFGSIQINNDGSALVLTGSSAHGQGHHTSFAQLAADLTGIPFDRIEVRHGDTDEVKRGGGTGGSRSLQAGGSAVWEATEAVVEKAKHAAAALLEANPADIVLDTDTGSFSVAGTPAVSTGWADIATHIEQSEGAPLQAEADFTPGGATFPFGVHLCVVEVDPGTGGVEIVRYVACDDAGTIVNPMIVEGQVHGGIASGALHALMEEFVYDEDGNPLTANFMDYALGSAAELPSFERLVQETPTDRNPLGSKGIGESGTIGAGPAVQNAVVDALSHLGVRHVDIPVTPQRVWRTLQSTGA